MLCECMLQLTSFSQAWLLGQLLLWSGHVLEAFVLQAGDKEEEEEVVAALKPGQRGAAQEESTKA
eukprot:5572360-Prorocentrum_lima.AAC.1